MSNDADDLSKETTETHSLSSKVVSFLEVVVVRHGIYSLAAVGLLLLLYGTLNPEPFPLEASYIIGSLWFIIPGIMIVGFQRDRHAYGLTLEKNPESVDLAFKAFPYFIITFAGYMLLMYLGWSYLEPLGALTMTGIFILSTLLIVRTIKKDYDDFNEIQTPHKTHRNNIIGLILLLLFPVLLGLALNQLTVLVVSTVVWQFIFSGFGEEVFFRGYIQSRLNQAFGKPYEWKGIQFGLGLFITAGLFAISHMFSIVDLFLGDFTIDWWYGTFTFVGGLLFGLIREKTRSVVASGTLHGLEAVGEGLGALFG